MRLSGEIGILNSMKVGMSIKRNYFISFGRLLVLIAIAATLAACGKGGSGSSSKTTNANLPIQTNGVNQTGTGTGSVIAKPLVTGNQVTISVDAGPVVGFSSVNVGYVSVTVCSPGSTTSCQTIDHVTVDTGSYGLRLLNSALLSNLTLPAAIASNGKAVGECVQYVVGSTWGSVRMADIYVGGESALTVPIQDIGDSPGGATTIPLDCSNGGAIQDTLATLGSNGILGVGPFVNDCDACLYQVIPATYYTCATTGCVNSTVASTQVVRNPVASFALDNNGVLINLSSVGPGGSIGLLGNLIFGIGTQTSVTNVTTNIYNNVIQNTAIVYAVNPTTGNFTTSFNGSILTSYLDSGSNGLFFNDVSLPTCQVNNWAFCPSSPSVNLSAFNIPFNGISGVLINFTLVAADTLFLNNNIVAGNIGGPSGAANTFAWGLPFFYGRPVFTAISGAYTQVGYGPYWAY
jgi:hypothetical protein